MLTASHSDSPSFKIKENPERTAAEGLMFCSGGELKDGCLLIGAAGLYIAPGTELKVCTERVVFTMRVTEIQPRT